jgi:predicted nucleotidyltransferase
MRQIVFSGSVRAIYLNREEVIKRLKEIADEALKAFPVIKEIRLFGSLAKGEESGLSDVDILILLSESKEKNPLERLKPYFNFFSDRLDIAIDMIVATENEKENYEETLKGSILLGEK